LRPAPSQSPWRSAAGSASIIAGAFAVADGPAGGAKFMPFNRLHALAKHVGRDLSAVAFIALASFAAAGTVSAGAVTLTVYSAQHEQTVDLLTKAFTKETGIDVKVRNGEAPELASELVKEGASSPADVFFTENSPELELLSEKGLLAKVAPATLASVPAADSGPDGDWVGVLARENVLAFNKDLIKEADLPASLPRSRQARMERQGRDRPN
jgi:ABC-type glycerol-3-phosphate transport system substrate-binding protein